MEATFLVTLDLDNVESNELSLVADEIYDAIEGTGHGVTSVKPWARPSNSGPVNPTLPTIGLNSLANTPTESDGN